MPIMPNQANSKLKLIYSAGLDENNKNIIKNKTFSNISNEELYELGIAISDLQLYALIDLVRYEEYELINEI